jgi:hypothetical protein
VETNTGTFVSASDTGTNPTKADTDGDGLDDGDEVNTHGTNPHIADSDGDGFSDGSEITAGTDPNNANSNPDLSDDLTEGLIAYWPFDDDTLDSVGTNDGTLMGSDPNLAFSAGKFGNGVDLNGVDQYIETPIANEELFDFPEGNGFSVSAWFRVDNFAKNWQCLIAKGEGNKWRIHRRGGEQIITGNGGAADVSPGLTNVNDGQIHHLVLVSDPANGAVTLYVDGQVEGTSGAPALENNAHPMMIGENPDARGRTWDGLIDDVGIWNRPLSEEEIEYIYKGGEGNALFPSSQTPLSITNVAATFSPGASPVVTISFNSKTGKVYAVDRSIDLLLWEELDDGVEGQAESTDFIDDFSPAGSATMFYRVREVE